MALTKISSNLVADDAIVTGKIADGGVGTADLAANAVTSAKIAQNSILTKHIDDGQVDTAQIAADAITGAKIADDAISEEHLDVTVISSLTEVTAVDGDYVLIGDTSDSNNLKKVLVSSIRESADLLKTEATGDGSTVAYTLNEAPSSENATMVFFDGVYQHKSTYAVSGSTLTFDTAPLASTDIEIMASTTAALNVPADDSVQTAKIAANAVTSAKIASNSILTRHIDDDQITGDQLATNIAISGTLTTGGTIAPGGVLTANAGVVVDNITIDGTEIDLSSGDLTLDVAGRIDLSADDNGEVRLYDGSSMYGQFKDDDDRFKIQSLISNKDMMFVGNDNGSEVTALLLDMSEAGAATFNSTINGLTLAAGEIATDASNNFRLNTPNSLRINIDSDGNSSGEVFQIGHDQTAINSSNELLKLHEDGYIEFTGASDLRLTLGSQGTAGTNDSNWLRGNGTTLSYNSAGGDIFWEVSGAEKMRLDSGGKLGIGTNSPETGLHLYGTSNVASGFTIEQVYGGSSKKFGFQPVYNDDRLDIWYNSNATSAITIKDGGNVGIGDTSPSYKLDVEATGAAVASFRGESGPYGMIIGGNDAGWGYIGSIGHAGYDLTFNNDGYAHFGHSESTSFIYLGSQGGAYGGNSSHNLRASGGTFMYNSGSSNHVWEISGTQRGYLNTAGWQNGSDVSLKENIQDITYGLDTVKLLKPRKFDWKDSPADDKAEIGFIAQEVESIIPEIVSNSRPDGEGTSIKGMSYGNLTAVLVKAIQELEARVKELEG